MGEGLVGLSHLESVLSFLYGPAFIVVGIHDFRRKLVDHGLFRALTRVFQYPADSQRDLTIHPDFDRDLVRCSANPPGFDFQLRLHIVHRLRKDLEGVVFCLLLYRVKSTVDQPAGDAFLAIHHHAIDKPLHKNITILGIGQSLSFRYPSFPGHYSPPLLLGSFGAVFGSALFPVLYTTGVKRAAYDVVSNTRQILNPSATNQNHRVFLEVMTDTRYVRGHFHAVRKPHSGNLAQGGVRLLGSSCVDSHANSPSLRATHESW